MSTVLVSLQTILRIGQEVVARVQFAPFAVVRTDQPRQLDFLQTGPCMIGAVCFIVRN